MINRLIIIGITYILVNFLYHSFDHNWLEAIHSSIDNIGALLAVWLSNKIYPIRY